ncbi:hypothetical protein [Crateriforma conspicua]|uniref:Uncharacterized protein n=1 Tax=Crateriforma conspicua TaxID=2527996 RepID=A0A5C5XS02_9PLAN|nr:hypothetical protein [Crateriforma conspicua]TWT65674.1 hypothetical protein Pan14r_52230 [Crateriforma conspicua]
MKKQVSLRTVLLGCTGFAIVLFAGRLYRDHLTRTNVRLRDEIATLNNSIRGNVSKGSYDISIVNEIAADSDQTKRARIASLQARFESNRSREACLSVIYGDSTRPHRTPDP